MFAGTLAVVPVQLDVYIHIAKYKNTIYSSLHLWCSQATDCDSVTHGLYTARVYTCSIHEPVIVCEAAQTNSSFFMVDRHTGTQTVTVGWYWVRLVCIVLRFLVIAHSFSLFSASMFMSFLIRGA